MSKQNLKAKSLPVKGKKEAQQLTEQALQPIYNESDVNEGLDEVESNTQRLNEAMGVMQQEQQRQIMQENQRDFYQDKKGPPTKPSFRPPSKGGPQTKMKTRNFGNFDDENFPGALAKAQQQQQQQKQTISQSTAFFAPLEDDSHVCLDWPSAFTSDNILKLSLLEKVHKT
jgi:hypothetical protein